MHYASTPTVFICGEIQTGVMEKFMAEQLRPLTMVLSRNVCPLGVENTGDWLASWSEKNARNLKPINPYCDDKGNDFEILGKLCRVGIWRECR